MKLKKCFYLTGFLFSGLFVLYLYSKKVIKIRKSFLPGFIAYSVIKK